MNHSASHQKHADANLTSGGATLAPTTTSGADWASILRELPDREFFAPPRGEMPRGLPLENIPVGTTLTSSQIESLYINGYCRVQNALDSTALSIFQDKVQKLFAVEISQAGSEHVYKEAQVHRLAALCEKDPIFAELAHHQLVLEAARAIMGADSTLLMQMQNVRSPLPGKERQVWHSDSNRQLNIGVDGVTDLTAIWYLQPSKIGSGATLVLPGSHKFSHAPGARVNVPAGRELPGELSIETEAGDLVLMNGNIWHAGGQNLSDSPAPRILGHYVSEKAHVDRTRNGILKDLARTFEHTAHAKALILYKLT